MNVKSLRKLLSYPLLYMVISLMIAMMKHFQQIQSVTVDLDTTNLFILIALVHIVFVFVIVSPEEYQRKEFHVFEEILEGKTFTYIRKSIPRSSRMHLFTNKAREKIYAHGIRCEN